MSNSALDSARRKMREANVSPQAIEVFSYYHRALEAGESGLIAEETIAPFTDPARLDELNPSYEEQRAAIASTALIKLNGGLGTSMGLDKAKTLLPVRDGLNFLDIIARQTFDARDRYDARVPLIFMNSYRTEDDTIEYLKKYPDLGVDGLPLSFLQSQEPRLLVDTLEPISWPADPAAEWCPPGHGDLYVSLETTGVLDALLQRGFKFAQVSNGDNLGATPDGRIAAWFAASGAPFAMEVSRRTSNDRKGGHLARRKDDGALLLRESAQTPSEDVEAFEDISVHQYFNTNTIWLNLEALKETLSERDSVLGLPLIKNIKHVDGADTESPQVVQIETAMGSAIEVFEGAQAIQVGRDRFLPVKTTNELLLLRSDLYELTNDGSLLLQTKTTPTVTLLARYYARIEDFDERVPAAPSMVEADSLVVDGDWYFEPGASVRGSVELGPEGGVFH